jgi:predicted MPP superfamily phosphohydrolase
MVTLHPKKNMQKYHITRLKTYNCRYLILAAVITLWVVNGCGLREPPVLRVVQLCDPQFGFEKDSFIADVMRLDFAVKKINEIAPDIVVVAGDMVNDGSDDKAINFFKEIIAQVKAPVLLAAGNHDLPDPVTDEGIKRYRSLYGDDYQAVECKRRLFIVVNSQLWREAPEEESEQHELFIQEALQKAKKNRQVVIVLSHVPPFVASADEADEYYNLPASKREGILRLFNENGAIIWLAGHTHATIRRSYGNITILNGETTSKNFDDHPFGFRLLTVKPDQSFDWEFIGL